MSYSREPVNCDIPKGYTWSFVQALLHASVAHNRKLVVDWVPAGDLEDDTFKEVITDPPLPYSFCSTYVSSLHCFALCQTDND